MASSVSGASTISTLDMFNIVEQLKSQRHTNSTRKNYYAIWRQFNHFILRLDNKPRNWEDRLTLYIGYLINSNRQSAMVKSYISAIKSVLQENNIEIHENQFLMSALMCTCRLNNDVLITRLPIGKGLLEMVLKEMYNRYLDIGQKYLAILFTCVFSTAYLGLFRIGELAKSQHSVLAKDVKIATNKRKLKFILRSSKIHRSLRSRVKQSVVNQNHKAMFFCPYKLLQNYTVQRGSYRSEDEKFFVFVDRSAIPPNILRKCLKMSLVNLGFRSELYSFHSLHAGRAQDMLKCGVTIDTIKSLGRWKSNAVYKYLHY